MQTAAALNKSGTDIFRGWGNPISKWSVFLLFISTAVCASVAALTDTLSYLPLLPIAIISGYLFIRDPRVRFASTLGMIMLLQVFETAIFLQYAAAAIFNGGLLLVIIERRLLQNRKVTPSTLLLPFSLFLLWGSGVGLLNIMLGGVRFEQWYREILLWAPLFLMPIYYQDIIERKLNPEQFLKWSLLLLWIAVFLASYMKIRNNLVQAAYLFQIGISRYDTINGAFMMFIFLTLAMLVEKKNRLVLLAGFFFSVASLILTFGRTAWFASVMFMPVVILLGNKVERKNGWRFVWLILGCAVVFGVVGYIYIPTVKLALNFFWSKVTSVSLSAKDASMYNRYIEWNGLLHYVKDLPLTGGGFGATFKNYNWLLGITGQAHYTHSAYLGVVLKTGIVGFILLFISVIGYVVKGVKFLRDKRLTPTEKAYVRAGIATMLYTAVIGYTGNVFYQREMMMYIAFYWCYCIGIEYKLKQLDGAITV